MNRFPQEVPLPDQIPQKRRERLFDLLQTAKRGMVIRSAIVLAELFGFFYLGSSTLLADALSNLIDVASTFFLIFSIKAAEKPPDTHHPFGHGRLEPIAGLQLALFLVVAGGWMVVRQGQTLFTESSFIPIESYTWMIPCGAVIFLELSHHFIKKTAQRQNSPALLTEALHFRIDAISTLFAMITLILAAFYPHLSHVIDHCGAILIATFMIITGLISAKNNLSQLLDRTPSPQFFEKVRLAALQVEGVKETEKLKIQLYGPDAQVFIDIEVDPSLSVEKAHEITQRVRRAIQLEWPAVRDVVVHLEPYYPEDH